MEKKVITPRIPFQTAVLFLVFNRPETTKQVFEAIRQAKPPRLYVAADGPRASREGEFERVVQVRQIATAVDWPCEVKTLFRDGNLGCKKAVSEAITWFFEYETQGIILEDDCLPTQSFFTYCEQLLDRYKYNDDVYIISGDGRVASGLRFSADPDYVYCKYPLIWGWATWRRVWEKYDVNISEWPATKNTIINKISKINRSKDFWLKTFNNLHEGRIDTWDYQLTYLLIKDDALAVIPTKNQIKNIGFGEDATHTFDSNSSAANVETVSFEHPVIICDPSPSDVEKINNYYDMYQFTEQPLIKRLILKIYRILFSK